MIGSKALLAWLRRHTALLQGREKPIKLKVKLEQI